MDINVSELEIRKYLLEMDEHIEEVKEMLDNPEGVEDDFFSEIEEVGKESLVLLEKVKDKINNSQGDERLKYIGYLTIKLGTIDMKFESLIEQAIDEYGDE